MPSPQPLKGRVAVVTGASRGIGQAIARRLASGGATVVVSARSLDESKDGLTGTLHDTKRLIEETGGKALAMACDVEDAGSRARLVAETLRHAGRLDILVNNAGRAIHTGIGNFTPEMEISQVQQYLIAPYDLARLVVPHMAAQGAGWIVNLGSNTALTPEGPPWNAYTTHGGAALYASLKAAIHRLTISLAAELQADNIAVNAVAPVRAVLTPGVDSLGVITEENKDIVEPIEHIAEAALDLVSGTPRALTGKIAFSYRYLDEIRRSTWSLDGARILFERT
jgi:3-oxoacyl-[acyl-carrier protein] reductase